MSTPATRFPKEKRYDLYPELLDSHVSRLVEANKAATSYIRDMELIQSGLRRITDFLSDRKLMKFVREQIRRSEIRDGRSDASEVKNLKKTPCFIAAEKIFPVIVESFQEKAQNDVSSKFVIHTYLQHLFNTPDDGDEQKVFHSDTFFHCVKFWYFPHEVSKDDGAFWYVPYSPIVTDKLIGWHAERVKDLKEGKYEPWRGPSHGQGSFRISPEEISGLGLTPIPVEVAEDTLIIGNVFGFHRRGDTKRPTNRLAIHGSIRLNDPFAYQ